MLLVPIILSKITIYLSRGLSIDSINSCKDIYLANNEFLPVYLGYFFVALSINNIVVLVCVYIIVFIFTLLSQSQYFNPIFLLFGYNFYHVKTDNGTRAFIIIKGPVVRSAKNISFNNLRRINNSTFIQP